MLSACSSYHGLGILLQLALCFTSHLTAPSLSLSLTSPPSLSPHTSHHPCLSRHTSHPLCLSPPTSLLPLSLSPPTSHPPRVSPLLTICHSITSHLTLFTSYIPFLTSHSHPPLSSLTYILQRHCIGSKTLTQTSARSGGVSVNAWRRESGGGD